MVICLEQVADLHMAQLMPLPLTVSCYSKIQIGFTFLVPAHLGSPRQGAVKRACVCVCVAYSLNTLADVVDVTDLHSRPEPCCAVQRCSPCSRVSSARSARRFPTAHSTDNVTVLDIAYKSAASVHTVCENLCHVTYPKRCNSETTEETKPRGEHRTKKSMKFLEFKSCKFKVLKVFEKSWNTIRFSFTWKMAILLKCESSKLHC